MPTKRDLILAAGAAAVATTARADMPTVEKLRLWPTGVPGGERPAGLRQEDRFTDMPDGRRDRGIVGVTDPVLEIWRPAVRAPRAAMLIVPGGGYRQVVIEKEGSV